MMPAEAAPSPAAGRSLLPREHGAWAQLGMPLASALALGGPSPAALLLTVATVLAFLAHEPWLVLLGHRGPRAREEDGPRAVRQLGALLGLAAGAGACGLWLAPPAARLALALPAALGLVVVALVRARQERTVPGELAVSSALASSGLMVALAGEAPLRAALGATAAWVLAFGTSVFAVHAVVVRAHTRGARELGPRSAAGVAVVALGGSALAVAGGLGWGVPAAVAPTALLSLAVCLGPFGARQLKLLGWGLVASTTATLALVVTLLQAR